MTWRDIQLGSELCDQDRLILDLVGQRSVRIYGDHKGFDKLCNIDQHSDLYLIFFNRPAWLSEIQTMLSEILSDDCQSLYIGINRYQVKGNDTHYQRSPQESTPGTELLHWLRQILEIQKFHVKKQGCLEKDQGRYFNFVQPLTWIYAEKSCSYVGQQ